MEVLLELGRYEFRAKFENNLITIPACIYLTEDGVLSCDNINTSVLTNDEFKNMLIDPISLLGRRFLDDKVQEYLAKNENIVMPVKNSKYFKIHLAQTITNVATSYSVEEIIGGMIQQLFEQFLTEETNKIDLNVKIFYPVKYTKKMDNSFREAFTFANIPTVTIAKISEHLHLKQMHTNSTILLLDFGFKSFRLYILKIPNDLNSYQLVDEYDFGFGSQDFDVLLFNEIAVRTDSVEMEYTSAQQFELMRLCDSVKKELSVQSSVEIEMGDGSELQVKVEEFEILIKRLVHKVFGKVQEMVKEHGVRFKFAKGGSVEIPYIRKHLEEYNIDVITL